MLKQTMGKIKRKLVLCVIFDESHVICVILSTSGR